MRSYDVSGHGRWGLPGDTVKRNTVLCVGALRELEEKSLLRDSLVRKFSTCNLHGAKIFKVLHDFFNLIGYLRKKCVGIFTEDVKAHTHIRAGRETVLVDSVFLPAARSH